MRTKYVGSEVGVLLRLARVIEPRQFRVAVHYAGIPTTPTLHCKRMASRLQPVGTQVVPFLHFESENQIPSSQISSFCPFYMHIKKIV